MGYSFDHYAGIWGYDIIFRGYEEKKGKLFIATARNDNDTRLFGRSLLPSIDMEDKEGWWNTFTITKKAQQKGTYIVKIVNVRPDKDGYPIFEVDVLCSVEESILINKPITRLFLASNCFTEIYRSALEPWNDEALQREMSKYTEFPKFVGTHVVAAAAVQKLLDGTITLEQVQEWLESPTDEEIRDEEIRQVAKTFLDNYRVKDFKPYEVKEDAPNWVKEWNKNESAKVEAFMATIDKMDVSAFPCICNEVQRRLNAKIGICAKDFVDWHQSYRWKVACGTVDAVDGSYLDQIEGYLKAEAARKAAKDAQKEASKAKKTAAKKAKKLAAKLAKEQAKTQNQTES